MVVVVAVPSDVLEETVDEDSAESVCVGCTLSTAKGSRARITWRTWNMMRDLMGLFFSLRNSKMGRVR